MPKARTHLQCKADFSSVKRFVHRGAPEGADASAEAKSESSSWNPWADEMASWVDSVNSTVSGWVEGARTAANTPAELAKRANTLTQGLVDQGQAWAGGKIDQGQATLAGKIESGRSTVQGGIASAQETVNRVVNPVSQYLEGSQAGRDMQALRDRQEDLTRSAQRGIDSAVASVQAVVRLIGDVPQGMAEAQADAYQEAMSKVVDAQASGAIAYVDGVAANVSGEWAQAVGGVMDNIARFAGAESGVRMTASVINDIYQEAVGPLQGEFANRMEAKRATARQQIADTRRP